MEALLEPLELLLLATTINYMDRQTLSNAASRVTKEFNLSQEQYGDLELAFGWAFAVGSLFFGFLADRFRVYWLYPIVLSAPARSMAWRSDWLGRVAPWYSANLMLFQRSDR